MTKFREAARRFFVKAGSWRLTHRAISYKDRYERDIEGCYAGLRLVRRIT